MSSRDYYNDVERKISEETYWNFNILPKNKTIELYESLDYYGTCTLTKAEFKQYIEALQNAYNEMVD